MRWLWILIIVSIGAFPVLAQEMSPIHNITRTIISSSAEARALAGRHLFTEAYISNPNFNSYEHFGSVTITNENGLYRLRGQHEAYDTHFRFTNKDVGGKVTINGLIQEIHHDFFIVVGTIEYTRINDFKKSAASQPVQCQAKGSFVFSKKTHPAYWRLQRSHKICAENTNISIRLDIFTAPLVGEPPNGRTHRRRN